MTRIARDWMEKGFEGPSWYKALERDKERERIGARIKELREKKGIDQKTLAEASGIYESNLIRIEQGRYSVSMDILTNIAEALDVKLDFVETTEEE